MKILVTGGAGFIGSQLSKSLIRNGHEVHILDNFHHYYSEDLKNIRINEVKKIGQFVLYNQDLLDEDQCMDLFKRESFQAIIHLAALPGVAYSIEHPLAYVDYDIKATINVLKAAGESGVEKVIFASSSSVYGNIQGQPLNESMATGKVISPYAASKFGAESFCHVYQNMYQFQLSILRFFTVYGPWGRPDMAIPKFIQKLLKNEPIEIYGRNTARDYTYIDDIIAGIERVLLSNHQSEIFNLGAGSPVSIEKLISLLQMHFPDMKIFHSHLRQGDVTMTWADCTKAKEKLGFIAGTSIEKGIEKTIKWAMSNDEWYF